MKTDVKYTIQRFCSLEAFSGYSIQPESRDCELYECGVLDGNASIEQLLEAVIEKKNLHWNNSVSVDDVIKVFRASERYLYYVDSVGLQQLNAF